MAYEFERDEWRAAVRQLTEADRDININARRESLGIVGEATDNIGADDD